MRAALGLAIIPLAAWSQTSAQETQRGKEKPSKADAYFHFTLAHMYADMAATSFGRNREYLDKAIENHRLAVEADPRTPPLRFQSSRGFAPATPARPGPEVPAPERK